MRIYKKGERVLVTETEEIGVVEEAIPGTYELPVGLMLGAGQTDINVPMQGGEMSYRVKLASGEIVTLTDRDVRNPPKGATQAPAKPAAAPAVAAPKKRK